MTATLQKGGERVQPRYQADIGFRVRGKVLQPPVDGGTQVKNGDLLARLDPQQYRQDLEVAKSEVAVAEAKVTRSQAREYRQRELLKNGFTTQVAYDQALKPSRPRERSSMRRSKNSHLRSPFDGLANDLLGPSREQ